MIIKKSEYLVKGKFTKQDAIEILSSLFGSKIQFHSLAAFGLEERAQKKATHHNRRKQELSQSLENLIQKINNYSEKGNDVLIDCCVNISLSKKSKTKRI